MFGYMFNVGWVCVIVIVWFLKWQSTWILLKRVLKCSCGALCFHSGPLGPALHNLEVQQSACWSDVGAARAHPLCESGHFSFCLLKISPGLKACFALISQRPEACRGAAPIACELVVWGMLNRNIRYKRLVRTVLIKADRKGVLDPLTKKINK